MGSGVGLRGGWRRWGLGAWPGLVWLLVLGAHGHGASAQGEGEGAGAWEDRAIELAFQQDFDEALMARIMALEAQSGSEALQQRRELARLASWRPELLRTIRHGDGESWIESMSVTPDGSRLVTASDEVSVWDLETAQRIAGPWPVEDWGDEFVIDPTGTRVAMSLSGTRFVVRDVDTGRILVDSEGILPETRVRDMAWGPRGRLLATGSAQAGVGTRVWDVDEGRLRYETVSLGPTTAMTRTSPDGMYLAVASETLILVTEFETGALVALEGTPDDEVPRALEFHPLESRLVGFGIDIDLPDTGSKWSWKTRCQRSRSFSNMSEMAFDVESRRWIAAGGSEYRFLGDWTGLRLPPPMQVFDRGSWDEWSGSFGISTVSPGGTRAAMNGPPNNFRVWDTRTGLQLEAPRTDGDFVTRLEFVGEDRILSANENGVIRLWSLGGDWMAPEAIGPEAGALLVVDGGRTSVGLHQVDRFELLDEDGSSSLVHSGSRGDVEPVFDATGRRFTLPVDSRRWRVWDIETEGWVGDAFYLNSHEPYGFPTVDSIAMGDRDESNWVVDLESGVVIQDLQGIEVEGFSLDSNGETWAWHRHREPTHWRADQPTPPWGDAGERWRICANDGSGSLLGREGSNVAWSDTDGVSRRVDEILRSVIAVDEDSVRSRRSWSTSASRAIFEADDRVVILDPVVGECVSVLEGPSDFVDRRVVGDRLLSLAEGELSVWDLSDGRLLVRHELDCRALTAWPVPRSSRVLLRRSGANLRSWDNASGEAKGGPEWIDGIDAQLDPRVVDNARVDSDSNPTCVFHAESGAVWRPGTENDFAEGNGFAFSPDGSRCIRWNKGESWKLAVTETGQILETSPSDYLEGVEFSKEGDRIFAIDAPAWEGEVRVSIVRSVDGSLASRFEIPDFDVHGYALNWAGDRLVIWYRRELRVIELSTGVELASKTLPEDVERAEFLPSGALAVRLWTEARLEVWRLDPLEIHKTWGPTVASRWVGGEWVGSEDPRRPTWTSLETGEVRSVPPGTGTGVVLLGFCDPPRLRWYPRSAHLVRTVDGAARAFATRRWTPDGSLARGRTPVLFDGSRAVVGARRTPDGMAPVIVDFGPAKDDPMLGEPDELLETWSLRLGLEVNEAGEIVPRR